MKRQMKKIITFIVLTLMIGPGLSAFAEESIQEVATPQVLPGSFWYLFKTFGENIRTFFTFNSEAKLERHQFLSEKRLAELEAIMEKAPQLIDRAADNYQRQQEKLAQALNRVVQRGPEEEELIDRLEDSMGQHLEKLESLKEQVPTEAKAALERAHSAAQQGQIKAIEAISNWQPDEAFNRYKDLMTERLDRLEQVAELDNEEAESILGQWRVYNEALRRMSKSRAEISDQVNAWQAQALERLDALEDRFQSMEQFREHLRDARSEAVDTQVEALRKIREENRWAEVENDFSETALRRIERLRERVQEMDQDCPAEDQAECLNERRRMVEALSQEYQKYMALGEEIIQQDWDNLSVEGHDTLSQASQEAIQTLESVYDVAPEEARLSLDQAITAAERLRHLNNQAFETENQLGEPMSDNPSIERVQERARQEMAPQLEAIKNRLGQ